MNSSNCQTSSCSVFRRDKTIQIRLTFEPKVSLGDITVPIGNIN